MSAYGLEAATGELFSLQASHDALLAALKALVDAGEFCVEGDDELEIMLRLGRATDAAKRAIAKAEGRDA